MLEKAWKRVNLLKLVRTSLPLKRIMKKWVHLLIPEMMIKQMGKSVVNLRARPRPHP